MKLTLSKSQSKGMLGGVRFEVKAQVSLAPEEQRLVRHYGLENEILFQKTLNNLWGQPTDVKAEVRVRHLLRGETYKCKDLGEVISYSESLKSACETLVAYLEVAD
jgi:hypothetical protein